jgi:L-ascorbate metabolism protein UlaG (beta-lactamase superfamily)
VEKSFKDYQSIQTRVTAATPTWKERVAMKVSGIDFEVLGIRHGTGRHASVQNLGHIIKLGGKKLLHVGDADTAMENFEDLKLNEEGIDVAFIPFWFLIDTEGQSIVRDLIKPKHIIAVHISPRDRDDAAEQIRKAFPEATAFTTMLEKKSY